METWDMNEVKATDRVNSNRTDGFLWSSLKDAWWLKAKIKTFSDGVFSDYKYNTSESCITKGPMWCKISTFHFKE